MKTRERRETEEMDLFRSRLDQIISMNHELVRLAKTVSSEVIEARCDSVRGSVQIFSHIFSSDGGFGLGLLGLEQGPPGPRYERQNPTGRLHRRHP